MPTIRHVYQLIQYGDYVFSIDLQDSYLHIPIVKHHHHFLLYVWYNTPYQLKVLPFGQATAPRVSKPPLNLSCAFATAMVSVLLSIWMTSWSQFTLSGQVRGLHFFVPYLFTLDCILIFPSLTFAPRRPFVSWSYVWILSICQYLYLPIN